MQLPLMINIVKTLVIKKLQTHNVLFTPFSYVFKSNFKNIVKEFWLVSNKIVILYMLKYKIALFLYFRN